MEESNNEKNRKSYIDNDNSIGKFVFNRLWEICIILHTLKCKNETGTLNYSGKLEKGNVIVYVDYDGTKKELFKLSDGEEINSSLKDLKEGTVYVIFETDGKCENGEFEFELE